jgi:hypothetical protein
MTWDKGFNFRGTSGYVTDGTDETYVLGDSYPTTRNGVTFGWDAGVYAYDEYSSYDRRLVGANRGGYDTTRHFRVDLPAAGNYLIRAAFGSVNIGSAIAAAFLDDAAVLSSVNGEHGSSEWRDATGALRGWVTWAAENASVTYTFASTTLRVRHINNNTIWNLSSTAHIFLSQEEGGDPPAVSIPVIMAHLRQQGIA